MAIFVHQQLNCEEGTDAEDKSVRMCERFIKDHSLGNLRLSKPLPSLKLIRR